MPTPVELGAEDPAGLETQVLLARARAKLLGWSDVPVTIGKYRIARRIGAGGMGVVYAAHDDELDRPIAIKILRSDLAEGSVGRARLLREAQAMARLSHPNVIHVYEVGHAGDTVFMAMELVEGVTLRRWMDARAHTPAEIVEMFTRAGDGLVAAHAVGIVHRDFKPDNVLVGHDGRPRVLDFGLARSTAELTSSHDVEAVPAPSSSFASGDLTRTGTVVGTPAYMAPEQIERGAIDEQSDQFAFCVALFEALYGKRPFRGSSYTELAASISRDGPISVAPHRHGVPDELHAAVVRGLSRAPSERHASMQALLDELRRAIARPTRSARQRAALIAGLGVTSAAVVGALTLMAMRSPIAASGGTGGAEESTPDPSDAPASDDWADIVAASDLPPLQPVPSASDRAGVTIQRLANGLTVYVANRPLEPFVSAALVIRAGAPEDGEAHQGLGLLTLSAAHQGSARLGVLDADHERPYLDMQHTLLRAREQTEDPAIRRSLLDGVDAAYRASADELLTSEPAVALTALGARFPTTLFGVGSMLTSDVPRDRLAAWSDIVAELVERPSLRGLHVAAAHELEFLRAINGGALAENVRLREVAAATGIHNDVERMVDTISAIPITDVIAYHASYWRPNNAALVLVGDIRPDEALALAERSFGAWEPAPIPARAPARGDLRAPVIRRVQDSGGAEVSLTWPLLAPGRDDPTRAALAVALGQRDGLLFAAMPELAASDTMAQVSSYRSFDVFARPDPGVDPERVAAELQAALERVARDELDDAVWDRVLARAELQRHVWARSAPRLTETIARTFVDGRPWQEVGEELSGAGPTRAEIIDLLRRTLARPSITIIKQSGPQWDLAIPQIEASALEVRLDRHGPLVRELLAAPRVAAEPQFLVAGNQFECTPYGSGSVVTTRQEGPLFQLSWVVPVGSRRDPLVCAAAQARAHAASIAGVEISAQCGLDDTRIQVIGTSSRFERVWPELLAWLRAGEIAQDVATRWIGEELQWRESSRSDRFARTQALVAWANTGSSGLDATLASDAELRSGGARRLQLAWRSASQLDPDVLYVGPAPARLRELLPPPPGKAATPPSAWRGRDLDRTTVFVLDTPGVPQLSLSFGIAMPLDRPEDALAAQALHEILAVEITDGRIGSAQMMSLARARGSLAPRVWGIETMAKPEQILEVIDAAITSLRRRPDPTAFAIARARLETSFRNLRIAPVDIPTHVHAWGADANDPRVAQWLSLPGLSYDSFAAYTDALASRPIVITLTGDLRGIDLDAVAERADVVRVAPEFLRDPSLADIDFNTPPIAQG